MLGGMREASTPDINRRRPAFGDGLRYVFGRQTTSRPAPGALYWAAKGRATRGGGKVFFFEKKKQKTFGRCRGHFTRVYAISKLYASNKKFFPRQSDC
jgi:hypothetical protein